MAIELQSFRDDYLDHIEQQIPTEDGDEHGFEITDDGAADWAVQKIAQAQQRIDGRRAFVQAEIERLRQWQEAEDEKDQRTIDFMTGLLNSYFDRLRARGVLGDRKSYNLPHGRLQVRATGPKWKRIDDKALTEWALSVPLMDLVRVRVEPNWREIAKNLRPKSDHIGAPALYVDPDTGEMVEVPGVALEAPVGEKFSVSPEVI